MKKLKRLSLFVAVLVFFCAGEGIGTSQQNLPNAAPTPAVSATAPGQNTAAAPAAPSVATWEDSFSGSQLDESKWERFTFEGGGGGKLKVGSGMLQMRATNGSRSGVRTKETFSGDRFVVSAVVAKVGPGFPSPGDQGVPIGYATLTVLFDGSGRNRIEWMVTSEGTFEAWSIVDGKGERLDNRHLAMKKIESPTLSIARKGDEFYFALNGEVGCQKVIKDIPQSFRVMLYGFGSSENDWKSIMVQTAKK